MQVSHFSYGRGREGNGVHIGRLTIWFSYETPIAFREGYGRPVVRQNDWGPTTGRHMGEVPHNRDERIPGGEFNERLAAALAREGATWSEHVQPHADNFPAREDDGGQLRAEALVAEMTGDAEGKSTAVVSES